MQLAKGHAAIDNHKQHPKSLLLFESAHKAHVRFIGEMAYVGHHTQERPARRNQMRKAIEHE